MSDFTSMLVPLAGTFPGWPAVDQPSAVQSLAVLVGVPVAISAVLALLVYAGRLARRGKGTEEHMTEPVWVGGQAAEVDGAPAARELTAAEETDTPTGGASVRW